MLFQAGCNEKQDSGTQWLLWFQNINFCPSKKWICLDKRFGCLISYCDYWIILIKKIFWIINEPINAVQLFFTSNVSCFS